MNKLKTWKPRIVTINSILTIVFVSLCPLVAVSENHKLFTFGSTVSKVVAAQGDPDAIDEHTAQLPGDSERIVFGFTYKYGKSEVYFDKDDGRVDGWLSHRDTPLKTLFQKDHLLLPIDWNKEYITLGSSEDEVIAVQGKPDYIHRYKWGGHSLIYYDNYGEGSSVRFEKGRVTGWHISTMPLKVKLVPDENTVVKDYFTIGSTLDEVAAVQGTPDYLSYPYSLLYGSSKVSLKDGRVASWQNTTANPLKVRLLPKQKTINKGYFTLESTKDEVLAVQGTPDSFFGDSDSESQFYYGSSDSFFAMSIVYFEEDRVVGWSRRSIQLRTGPYSGDCFTIGSTKEEVLAIQGTPDDHGDIFRYRTAAVEFQNGRVTGWRHINGSRRLKVKLLPKQKAYDRKYITIGSTQDEVLALLGTPNSYGTNYQVTPTTDYDARFAYDGLFVYFRNDRVTEWLQSCYSTLEASFEKNPVNSSVSANSVQLASTPSQGANFTIGSTIEEVLAMQGTPDERVVPTLISGDKYRHDYDLHFVYGPSFVGFIDGRVAGWKSAGNRRLNVVLRPGQSTGERSHFTVGSTIDEVLAVQGTPDVYSIFGALEFEYGHSVVTFINGHVSDWNSSSKSPLKVKYPLTGKITTP